MAEIKNSFGRAGEGWHQGKYEGEKVIILSVLDTHNDVYASTATCQFVSSQTDLDRPTIPVQYLVPVEPERVGDMVIIVHGERIGEEGKVQDDGSDQWMVSVTGTQLLVEVRRSAMARLMPVDGAR